MRPTSKALCESYLDWQDRERGRTPITVDRYGYTMRQWMTHLGPTHVLDASLDDLRSFVLAPVQRATRTSAVGDEPSAATRKRKATELRSFYKWLQSEGLRVDDPSVRLHAPTVHNENPKPVPFALWQALWGSGLSDKQRAAFGLAYFGGLRRTEIVGVGPRNFHQGRIVDFRRKGGKRQSLPLESCARLIEKELPHLINGCADSFLDPLADVLHQRRHEAVVFPWAVGRAGEGSRVNKQLIAALTVAGLDPLSFSPHQMRHSFCTNLLECGVQLLDVSRLAGHSSIVVTQRYLASSDDPIAGLLD